MKPVVFFSIIAIGAWFNWPLFEDPKIVSRAHTSEQMIFNEEGTEGQFVYNVRGDAAVSGNIIHYEWMDGSLNHSAGDMILYYLDQEGYQKFKSRYTGPLSKCPAPFLNANQKTVMLIGSTPELSSRLQNLFDEAKGLDSPFSIQGSELQFYSAKMPDGRNLDMRFGMPLVKVDAIEH